MLQEAPQTSKRPSNALTNMITEPVVQSVVAPVVIGTMDQGFGVPYYKEGRVLDYGNLGQFTIVDRSPEGNNAIGNSGRGISTDGVNDRINDFADTIFSPPLPYGYYTISGNVRPEGTTAHFFLGGSIGEVTLTGLTPGVWQSVAHKVLGTFNGFSLGMSTILSFTKADWSDWSVTQDSSGDVKLHYTLADWSDPTADGLNGKTIVDSGPNQLHGTCTGCEGFTGEGIDPAVAGIVGYDDAQWFNGVDTSLDYGSPLFPAAGDFDETFTWRIANTVLPSTFIYAMSQGTSGTDFIGVALSNIDGKLVVYHCNGTPVIQSSGSILNSMQKVRLLKVSGDLTLYLNDTLVATVAVTGSISQTNTIWGDTSFLTGTRNILGLLQGDSVTGTPSGTFVTVGQKRATIPQTADRNWNKYQWFNGTDTYVSVAGMSATVNYFGACTISADIYVSDASASGAVFSLGGSCYRLFALGGEWKLNADGATGISVVAGHNNVSITFNASGQAIAATIGGVSWSGTINAGINPATSFYVGGRLSGTVGLIWDGIVYNFAITGSSVKNFAYTGLGNDPWKDTTGSNNGTESGTFTRELVSASDADDQIDALGTAILEPRTNAQVVNIFGDGELVKTPAAASLDTIKTVSGWIWHDGTARTVIDLGTPTVGTTATDLTSSGFTGVTYFVNGQSGTALSAGWNHCVVASTAALATDDIDILAKSGSSIDYITTLTVAEALQNFDAQKARYNI